MEINGKIYRNLEGQVAYLTEKWDDLQDQINDVKGKLTHYIVVEELPTEDIDTSAVYLVGPKGTEPNTYYEEWVYVETSEGTWSWEKLGDTDSVDLSGYLQIRDGATNYPQAYVKNANGTQEMLNASTGASSSTAGFIVLRASGGHISLPGAPTEGWQATNKNYVDTNFLAKQTGSTSYSQVYTKNANGTQGMANIINDSGTAYSIAQRDSAGRLRCKDPAGNGEEVVNVGYANDHYLAKNTNSSSYGQVYGKATDGTQTMWIINGNPVSDSIPLRFAYGQIKLPNQTTYPPTDDDYAVSKRYVDNVVGQLLYLHDIDLAITVDSTNKLFVKAYLINDDPTAVTSFDRIVYKRIDVQWGAFGAHSYDAVPAAITKMPDGFRQDDFEEPLIGFLYQYFSGGNLISAHTTSTMSTTVTDTVISW